MSPGDLVDLPAYPPRSFGMPRETLDRKIRNLLDELLVMDSMVESACADAVDALKKRDLKKAREVYSFDSQINRRRFDVENEVIVTIATQQPIMAGDLRLIASILEVVGELERIGDYSKGIAKICLMIGNEPHIKPLIDIPKMSEITIDMLHRAVSAFVILDVDAARIIPKDDDKVDQLYNMVYKELIEVILQDPSTVDQANHLMWAAHNLERMADRVTNICERTIYAATSQLIELETTDDESPEFDH
jgi:phosphate transport system protein